MKKIHGWLPNRQFICVGDSTQSDPEAYAEMYKKFPDWIVSYSVSFKTRIILLPRQFQSGAWHASGLLRALSGPGDSPGKPRSR